MTAEVESKHAEPWVQRGCKGLYHGGGVAFEALGEVTAARIVATMNACAGFERPEELRKIVEYLRKLVAETEADDSLGSIYCDQRVVALLARLAKPADAEGGG